MCIHLGQMHRTIKNFSIYLRTRKLSLDIFVKERRRNHLTRVICARADMHMVIPATSDVYVPLSCPGSPRVPGAFFVKQPKAAGSSLPIPCTLYRERSRSLVARLLLVTGSHVHVLCCTVSFSSRRRQRTLQFSPNHVGNSPAAHPPRLYLSLYRTRLLYRLQLSPVT